MMSALRCSPLRHGHESRLCTSGCDCALIEGEDARRSVLRTLGGVGIISSRRETAKSLCALSADLPGAITTIRKLATSQPTRCEVIERIGYRFEKDSRNTCSHADRELSLRRIPLLLNDHLGRHCGGNLDHLSLKR